MASKGWTTPSFLGIWVVGLKACFCAQSNGGLSAAACVTCLQCNWIRRACQGAPKGCMVYNLVIAHLQVQGSLPSEAHLHPGHKAGHVVLTKELPAPQEMQPPSGKSHTTKQPP